MTLQDDLAIDNRSSSVGSRTGDISLLFCLEAMQCKRVVKVETEDEVLLQEDLMKWHHAKQGPNGAMFETRAHVISRSDSGIDLIMMRPPCTSP